MLSTTCAMSKQGCRDPRLFFLPGLHGHGNTCAPPAIDCAGGLLPRADLALGPECSSKADRLARVCREIDDRRIDQAVVCGIRSAGCRIALRFGRTSPATATPRWCWRPRPDRGTKAAAQQRKYATRQCPYVFGPLVLARRRSVQGEVLKRALPLRSDALGVLNGRSQDLSTPVVRRCQDQRAARRRRVSRRSRHRRRTAEASSAQP